MKAMQLARFLMLYPDAEVLVDIGSKGRDAIRSVDLQTSLTASNEYNAVLVVEDTGFPRARRG